MVVSLFYLMAVAHNFRSIAAVLAAALGLALISAAEAQKDGNTIVFATFGDWGWSAAGTLHIPELFHKLLV